LRCGFARRTTARPADVPPGAPLDEREVPPVVPADAPVPEVPDSVAPAVQAPVVPPPLPLPLSLFPPPVLKRLLGTLVMPELVLLGCCCARRS
jgi:hypothetical protein